MDEVGLETDPFESLANGIHHGGRAADERRCFAAASRKELLEHTHIEPPGGALEIPLPRQDVIY